MRLIILILLAVALIGCDKSLPIDQPAYAQGIRECSLHGGVNTMRGNHRISNNVKEYYIECKDDTFIILPAKLIKR